MKKKHKTGCKCCDEGKEAVETFEKEMIAKCGWYAHYVFDDDTYPFKANYHTHGLPQKYGHTDLQICLPIPADTVQSVFWDVVRRIEKGETFKAGDTAFDIIQNYPVTFIDAVELDRKVLRIIFPDKTGCIDKAEIEEPYEKQWQVISQN